IRYLEDLSSDISLFSVKDRLINLLLANLNPDDKLRYNILQNLSNTQIASLLGTVRAVLERAINDLESKEHIKTTRKNIQTTSKFIEKYSKMLPK
ncbi:MAG: helix-turn-helix domain-containing protein, partial [Sulfurimonas sp.]